MGACPEVGATCTIDPPPGSLAPSVVCECAADRRWCCDGNCSGTGTGGSGQGGTGGGTGTLSCNEFQMQISEKLAAAQECCPECPAVQCTETVSDLCCAQSVTSKGSAEAQEVTALVQRAQQAGCSCGSLAPCPNAPSSNCIADTAMTSGRCE